MGAVEYAVQGQSQLDHAEIGREMSASLRDLLDQEGADLAGELLQLWDTERTDVRRGLDGLEHRSI